MRGRGFGLDSEGKGALLTLSDPTLGGFSSVLLPQGLALAWWEVPDGGTVVTNTHVCLQILESSQTLLSVLKREAGNLTKATASEQKSSGKDS